MSAPSNTDFISGIDPTNFPTISGAQLLNLVAVATPFTDKGLLLVTTDVAGNPTVPNATVTTKWQNYLWVRISATTVSAYLWNPNGAVDATYLQWVSINVSGIAPGSIIGSMIADNTITAGKIISIDFSQITGFPGNLPPSGAAGGDLTGTYPNPSIAALAVTTAKIALKNITDGLVADQTLTLRTLAPFSGSANDMCKVNASATAVEAFTPSSIVRATTIEPTGNALKVVRVNSTADGYEVIAQSAVGGRVLQVVQTLDNTPDSTTQQCTLTTAPTTANNKLIASLTAAITPMNVGSTLLVEMGIWLCASNHNSALNATLFQDAGANALAVGTADSAANTFPVLVELKYAVASGSLTARTFKAGMSISTANTVDYNSTDGATKLFGGTLGVNSYLKVTEYL